MKPHANTNEQVGLTRAFTHHDVPSVEAEAFRKALSRLAAAVNVVTTDGPAGRCGVTASAVCSVSDTPPTVLVCLNRAYRMNGFARSNGVFCINVLGADQQEIAEMFAGVGEIEMDQRFARCGATQDLERAPVLANAIAAIDCDITEIREIGTHSVMFGAVRAIRLGAERSTAPLVYHHRHYHTVTSLTSKGETA